MKKLMLSLLVVCMLSAMLPTGMTPLSATTAVSAADPNLIFDMDLSSCSTQNPQQVADKSGANMVESFGYLQWKDATSYVDPSESNKVEYGQIEGKGTPYLTFADYNAETDTTANDNRALYVNFKASEIANRNIANANAVTIETWAKLDEDGQAGKYAQLFQWGCNSKYNASSYIYHTSFSAQFNTKGANDISFYPDRAGAHNGGGAEAKFLIGDEYGGKWVHYAFVREYLEAKSQWQITLYINGVPTVQTKGETTGRTNYTVPYTSTGGCNNEHYPTTLMIGCVEKAANKSVAGSFATFKVYDDARTAEEVKSEFQKTRTNFYNLVPQLKSISFENQNNQKIDDRTVLLKDATSVTATAEIVDCPEDAIGILALYNDRGELLSVEMADVGEPNSDAVTAMTATLAANQAYRGVFFIWDGFSMVIPIFPTSIVGGKPDPLKITGGFYGDVENQEISYAEGTNNISANLSLTAGEPPENLTATLKLMRNKAAIYRNSANIVFTDGEASVNLAYAANGEYPSLPTMQEDDELVLTVTDGAVVLFEKRLPYADQSKIVDVILVAGQSNAEGQGGDATLSIKPDADTVYYNTMGNKALSTSGNKGWDSALAKTWHEETGRIVLLVKATWGGTGFPTIEDIDTGKMYTTGSRYFGLWNPDNGMPLTNTPGGATTDPSAFKPRDCYTLAKNAYQAAIASIDTDKYTIGRKIYFWNQGENENGSYTPAQYKEAFLEMHEALKTELGLEYVGILPVRSTILSSPPTGAENTRSVDTTLRLTGPRIAQYHLGATRADVFIVADTMERWSNNATIKQWFEEKYPYGYPLGDENMPTGWSTIMYTDNIHYNQYALNEFGPEAAKNMLNFIRGGGSIVDGIDLITPFGIEHIENGGTISLPAKDGSKDSGDGWTATLNGVIPVMPASSGIKGTFTLSGTTAAEMTAEGLIVPKACIDGDFSTLTVNYTENGVPKTMSFRVESPLKETSVSIEIASVFENRPAIYTLTTDDGYKATTDWLTTKLASLETEKGLNENTLKATMGLVPAWMGVKQGVMTWAEAQSYAALPRWGVANHTQNHTQTGFNTLSEEVLKQEINGGRETLKTNFPNEKIVGLYTPGGHNSDLIRKVAAEQHLSLRVVGGSYNQLPLTDAINTTSKTLYNLVAPTVDVNTTASEANGWIDDAINSGKGWLIECWHCVGDDVGYSPVPTAVAEEHLAYVADKAKAGQLWVTTLDEASVYAKQRLYTRTSLKSGTDVAGGTIVFGMEDDLDNTLYDATLTVNITLPAGWTNATAVQNGNALPVTIANGKISMNLLPDSGNVTITKAS